VPASNADVSAASQTAMSLYCPIVTPCIVDADGPEPVIAGHGPLAICPLNEIASSVPGRERSSGNVTRIISIRDNSDIAPDDLAISLRNSVHIVASFGVQ
jgi:hypothetical protein